MPSVRAATSAGSLLFREKDASFGKSRLPAEVAEEQTAGRGRGSLLFREKDASFGRTGGRSLHRYGIGRANLVIVMKVFAENCPLDQGRRCARRKRLSRG